MPAPEVQPVHYDLADAVGTITLRRPDRGNALDLATVEALGVAVRQARRDDVHVVVLRAEGDAFCVGGSLDAFAAAADREYYIDDLAESLHRVVSDLQRMDAVVVSVVHGVAAGAGVPLAAAADLILAGESARFTLAYTKVGLSPDGGSSLLAASLGLHRSLHLALLNPVLTAHDAQQAGLVAAVWPDAELARSVERTVAQLRSGSRSAQVAAKHLLRRAATPDAEGALRRETLAIRAAAAGPDGVEGVDAFLAKRPPRFPSTLTTNQEPNHA